MSCKTVAGWAIAGLLLLMEVSLAFGQEPAPAPEFALGDYFRLGRYGGEPILWRYMDTSEEDGKLLLSDKILCIKAFDAKGGEEGSIHYKDGSNFWEESTLRAWLNSTAPAGEVVWPGNNPPNENAVEAKVISYAEEQGFLSEDNFTDAERSLMKTVSQWTLLPDNKLYLSTNGKDYPYKPRISHQTSTTDIPKFSIWDFGDKQRYNGAMCKVADTMFLPDGMQMYRILEKFKTTSTTATDLALKDKGIPFSPEEFRWYWLRSPYGFDTIAARYVNSGQYDYDLVTRTCGVRPAFYLNETRAVVAGGSGSEEDPYVLDSRKVGGIAVFHNGSEVLAGQEPVMENDRVLVPLRAIFEATGAEVEWEDETQTVTARTCMGTVIMQADNPVMTINGEAIELDVPPRVVNGRTLVPVRAAAQGSGAKVEWLEGLQRVVVTTGG